MSSKIIVLAKIVYTTYIECMRNYKKQDALSYCCNWDAGKCLGCDIRSKDSILIMYIDSKKAGKECTIDKECNYFNRVVVPGIIKE